jgi:hypothetical protein
VGTQAATASANDGVGAAQPIYVYGVTRAGMTAPQVSGVAGAEVQPIEFEGLAALTSPVADANVRARRRDLLAHSDVLTSAVEQGTVIPLQFGIVFRDADAVVSEFLRPRKAELEKLLGELDGKVELSVKGFYVQEVILAEVIGQNRRIARLRELTRKQPDGATYGARIELGELVAAELRACAQRDAAGILERLRPLALAVQVADEPIEHQVLRASFLVERERVRDFDEAMNDVARHEDGRIDFKYIGPLPPHSFVSVPWAS